MTAPTPDLPLLRKLIDWAAVEDEKPPVEREWNQMKYRDTEAQCGTAYCIAGMACEQAGYEWRGSSTLVLTDGRSVHDAARDLLGITDTDACFLFHADNTIDHLRLAGDKIAATVGERL